MNCNKHLIAGGLLAFSLAGVTDAAVVKLIADGVATGAVGTETYLKRLTANYRMSATNEYHLDGIIIVNPGVTMTIEPGTVIRGYNEISTMANRPGTLVVDRGGKIVAQGTAAKPIILTDQWDNNVPGQTAGSVTRSWIYRAGGTTSTTLTNHSYDYSRLGTLHGVWGGLVICGKAFGNWNKSATPALGDALIPIEGVGSVASAYGGGRDDNDSSGVITYVQIRYGGYPLADGSEINGLTLYCVGRGTELHHVEVYNNQDDGIEWFGGTVNGKYLVVYRAGDDTFDSDTGFRGKNQFLLGVQRNLGGTKYESGCSDKGMEMDGAENACVASPTATGMQEPLSASAWYNVTLIGWNGGDDTITNPSRPYRNGAIQMRDNCSAQIWNSVFMNFGHFGTLIENVTGVGNYHSYYHFNTDNLSASLPSTSATNNFGASVDRQFFYQAQQADKQATVKDCVFWGAGLVTCPSGLSGTTPVYGGDGTKGPVFTGGDNINLLAASYNNVDVYADADMPIRGLTVSAYSRDAAWGGAAFATAVGANAIAGDNVITINPLATNAALTVVRAVPADGWLTPVSYRGAFGPSNNWAQGWTTIAKLGVFGTYVPAQEEPAGVVTNTTVVTNTVTTVITNGVNGIVYQSSSQLISDSGTNGVTAASLTTSPVLTYSITSAGTYQLQMTESLSPASWVIVKTFTVQAASAASPVTVNLTDIVGGASQNSGDSRFYRLLKQ
jgi:hypothetical protein